MQGFDPVGDDPDAFGRFMRSKITERSCFVPTEVSVSARLVLRAATINLPYAAITL
jgi:hypothetical protein